MKMLYLIPVAIVENLLNHWKTIIPAAIIAAAWLFFLKKAFELGINAISKK